MPLEGTEMRLKDLHTNISLTLDIKKRELPVHGLDIMLNLNSVLMVTPQTSKILANVTELFGSEEDRTKPVKELQLGKISDCGHLFQKLRKINS
jgi:hypothetical protein